MSVLVDTRPPVTAVAVDAALISRLDQPGPRYWPYPSDLIPPVPVH